jgi:hypothetical protein
VAPLAIIVRGGTSVPTEHERRLIRSVLEACGVIDDNYFCSPATIRFAGSGAC